MKVKDVVICKSENGTFVVVGNCNKYDDYGILFESYRKKECFQWLKREQEVFKHMAAGLPELADKCKNMPLSSFCVSKSDYDRFGWTRGRSNRNVHMNACTDIEIPA